ncbi:MAG: hypothetical protein ABI769_13040 [Pseudomonadota bacterium]
MKSAPTNLSRLLTVFTLLCALSTSARAEATYISGHISNVTFAGDFVMIMVDAGLPGNCAGTSYGWIKIPPANKAMTAYVLGLSLSGNQAQTLLTVYTQGLVDGYCWVSQIDPAE